MAFSNLEYHIVFSTKDRRPLIRPDLLPRLVEYLGGTARGINCQLLAANGPADHIHLAMIAPSKLSIAECMRTVKANSSKWVHETFADAADFAWQDGYAAFTVSHSQLGRVIEYIRSQQEHHRKLTFTEELIGLLDRHGVKYDPKYVFA